MKFSPLSVLRYTLNKFQLSFPPKLTFLLLQGYGSSADFRCCPVWIVMLVVSCAEPKCSGLTVGVGKQFVSIVLYFLDFMGWGFLFRLGSGINLVILKKRKWFKLLCENYQITILLFCLYEAINIIKLLFSLLSKFILKPRNFLLKFKHLALSKQD